jgi:hypothetical protein
VNVGDIAHRPEETEKYFIFTKQEKFREVIINFKTNNLLLY